MANAKYDHVSGLVASGSFNWQSDLVYALLCRNVPFDPTDTRFNDVTAMGGSQVSSTLIGGRFVGTGGEAMGLPAVFPKVSKSVTYQVVVVCDLGDTNPQLIAFYDRDNANLPLTILNNGTFILRPTVLEGAETPSVGMWLQL